MVNDRSRKFSSDPNKSEEDTNCCSAGRNSAIADNHSINTETSFVSVKSPGNSFGLDISFPD